MAEHFPDPLKSFGELFQLQPRYILFSTTLYAGEGPDWWYLGEDGQHVAFYTRRSLEISAGRADTTSPATALTCIVFARSCPGSLAGNLPQTP